MSSPLFILRTRHAINDDFGKLNHDTLVVSEGNIYVPCFVIMGGVT